MRYRSEALQIREKIIVLISQKKRIITITLFTLEDAIFSTISDSLSFGIKGRKERSGNFDGISNNE